MRAIAVTALAAAAIALSASPASAAVVQDASCAVPAGLTINQDGNGSLKVAQRFTAVHTGSLTTATMRLGNPLGAIPGDWLFEVAAVDAAGVPSQLITSTTVANTVAANTVADVTGTFGIPAAVVAGTRYALMISRPGSDKYSVADAAADKCPGQQAYYQLAFNGPFLTDPQLDLGFSTTVDTPSGEQAAALKKCRKKKKKKHLSKKKYKRCLKKAKKLPL